MFIWRNPVSKVLYAIISVRVTYSNTDDCVCMKKILSLNTFFSTEPCQKLNHI